MRMKAHAPLAAMLLVASCAQLPSTPPRAVAAPTASGVWLGRLAGGPKGLRVQLRLDLAKTPPACLIDSPDQHASDIPCGDVKAAGNTLSLAVPAVRGSF